jgi:hypothetical protein
MRKIVKLFLLIILLLQIPFAWSLYRTHALNRYLTSLAQVSLLEVPFQDIRGGIHIHSSAGGHSLGTYEEIMAAARQLDYGYVFITEHRRARPPAKPGSVTEPGAGSDLVVIFGWEERLPEIGEALCSDDGSLCFQSGDDRPVAQGVAGLEIFNLHHSAQSNDTWFNRISFLYHRFFHPELFFFKLWDVDRSFLRTWDQELLKRRLTGIGGSDAHQNIGIVLSTTAGRRLFTLMVDPYPESLMAVTTHLMLAPEETVSRESVLDALAQGSAYVAFEKVADPTGFSFHALHANRAWPMGSVVDPGSVLVVQAPRQSEFQIVKDGTLWKTSSHGRLEIPVQEPGVYRVEVYPADPPSWLRGKPWIISNPIFVGARAAAAPP